MSLTYQAFIGSCEIDEDLDDFTVAGGAVSLTHAEYYCAGYTGDTQLVEHIQAIIRAEGGDLADMTCTMASATGLVTLDFQGHTTAVVWSDTELGEALGFVGNLSGAASYTGTYPMRWYWSPSLQPARLPVDLDEFWEFHSGTVAIQSPDGTAHGRVGEAAYYAQLSYELLASSEILRTSAGDETDNGTFEQWYRHVAHENMRVRILPDRTSYTATSDFKTGIFSATDRESELGGFRGWAEPTLGEDYHGLWDVDLFFIKSA